MIVAIEAVRAAGKVAEVRYKISAECHVEYWIALSSPRSAFATQEIC